MKDFIASECQLDRECQKVEIKDSYDFARNILKFIKMVDLSFYKSIVKKCYDNKLEEEENKLRVEKMNAIKELNKENKTEV